MSQTEKTLIIKFIDGEIYKVEQWNKMEYKEGNPFLTVECEGFQKMFRADQIKYVDVK